MVRSNDKRDVGFLADFRRMNVAVTRAKYQLIAVGDSDTVRADKHLETLIDFFFEHCDVRSAQQFRPEAKGTLIQKQPITTASDPKATASSPSVAADAAAVSLRSRLQDIITDFMADLSQTTLDLSQFRVPRERAMIHELCETMHLFHVSSGTGLDRFVTISKSPIEEAASKQTAPQQQQSSQQPQAPALPPTGPPAEFVMVKVSMFDPMSQYPFREVICHICAQKIPKSSQTLHEANCSRQHRREMASKPASAKSRTPNSQPEPKKTVKTRDLKDTLSNIDSDDEDALLDAALATRSRCAVAKCKNSIALMSSECRHCRNIYCMYHSMPEVCGLRMSYKLSITSSFRCMGAARMPKRLQEPTARTKRRRWWCRMACCYQPRGVHHGPRTGRIWSASCRPRLRRRLRRGQPRRRPPSDIELRHLLSIRLNFCAW